MQEGMDTTLQQMSELQQVWKLNFLFLYALFLMLSFHSEKERPILPLQLRWIHSFSIIESSLTRSSVCLLIVEDLS